MPPKKETRGWPLRLDDMIEAVRRILGYALGMSYESFESDQKTTDAVIRNFGILGEAARHVPPDVEAAHPQIPWRKMRGMRNFVVHVYHAVELPTVWETVQEDLPPLLPLLEAMLAELDASQDDQTP